MKVNYSKSPKGKEIAVKFFSTKMLKNALAQEPAEVKKIAEQEKFEAKEDTAVFLPNGFDEFKRALLLGTGDLPDEEKVRRATGSAIKFCQQKKIETASFFVPEFGTTKKAACAVAVVEGAVLANYSFQKYRTVKEDKKIFVKEIELVADLSEKEKQECNEAKTECENANFAREIINDNSSVVNPDYLEKFVKTHMAKTGLKIRVLQENELKKLGMGLFLAVGRGSESRPRLIAIEYDGNANSKEKYLFVGKGITFDTGGLDLKPGEAMYNMRDDMSGAAAVFGLLKTCNELKIKKNVVGILGLAENLIDAKSYRQGDVYTSMKGLTVENCSTDAEGRMVLADCIYYGVKNFKPKLVVDFSTLTGSAIRTFGEHTTFMCTTSDKFAQEFFEAGMKTFERVWKMPMFEEYRKEVKGTRSDLRSLGKKPNAGAIFAACFLDNFTENTPFIHLDIAGTAFIDEARTYYEAGATGVGIRLATEFLKQTK